MPGRVLQISISEGGVPKLPVKSTVVVGSLGIEGDKHRYSGHGGPRKALLLVASELVDALRAESWPVYYGALGENLTTHGLDHRAWHSGQRFKIGAVTIELTEPRAPCSQLNPFGAGIRERIYDAQVKALDSTSMHWGESGFYASVLTPGTLTAGAAIELVDPVYRLQTAPLDGW
ncbi:MAG TPA: MOSC domain-containing protein [Bryobacteraceae bacterium]|jgi:MOSC domain-containing protein YiiM|nr:MOSC domain-containing protein [Bryobacteraceae bacterium]